MPSLRRLIAAATLIGATALAPSLSAADDRFDRRDGERFEHGRRHDAAHLHDRGCGHDPRLQAHRKLARHDARYLDRRAHLERELQRLTWYAWR